MSDIIDAEQHAALIQQQLKVFTAFDRLHAGRDGDTEPLREEVRQAVTEKEAALRASGLVEDHGYYAADQALKQATRQHQTAS